MSEPERIIIDGVEVTVGERIELPLDHVLLNKTDPPAMQGVYKVTQGTWRRAT